MSIRAGSACLPLHTISAGRTSRPGIAVRALLALLTLAWLPAGCSIPFGCCVDTGYSYWALNDSAQPVTIDYRGQLHRTITLPPHTYDALGGESELDPRWSLAVVDDQCHVIQTWPLDASHDLLYISPAGERRFVTASAWGYGLRTANRASQAPSRSCGSPPPTGTAVSGSGAARGVGHSAAFRAL